MSAAGDEVSFVSGSLFAIDGDLTAQSAIEQDPVD